MSPRFAVNEGRIPPEKRIARRPGEPNPADNARFALWLFIVCEAMLFAGLASALIVLRFGARVWRPEGFDRLIPGLPLSNLAVMGLSIVFISLASRAVRRDDPDNLKLFLLLTLTAGAAFVGGQIAEFLRLERLGLPLAGDLFGGMFYLIAGVHGLHIAGGVLWGLVVLVRAFRGRYHMYRRAGVELFAYYWYFVAAVWFFLFGLLYLF